MKYWKELDYDISRKIELWGAGKKGKEVAKLLIKSNIEFDQLSNNDNKIGRDVYGVILKKSETNFLINSSQILIAVGSLDYNEKIKKAYAKIGCNLPRSLVSL